MIRREDIDRYCDHAKKAAQLRMKIMHGEYRLPVFAYCSLDRETLAEAAAIVGAKRSEDEDCVSFEYDGVVFYCMKESK